MRIESPAKMEKRLSDPTRPPFQNLLSHSRKSKRRSNRRNNLQDSLPNTWTSGPQNNQDVGLMSGIEYPPRMLWQSTGMTQNVPGNGQRLFTAMSDPSVCGYSPLPLTYTMQPVSLPAMYRMYQPIPMPNVRTVHNRHRRHCNEHSVNIRPNANNNIANGYGSLQENERLESTVHIAYQNGDYASLPPTANKDSGINGDELNSEHRRYSDPGLGPAEKLHHSDSDDSDSIESGSSTTTISRSNKLVLSLIEQMTELKKYNSQLFKELSETKLNLENIKTKLTQCKHSTPTDYQPGMLSELIREIREANKNCEENLVVKVRSMLEEKNNQQAKEIEELKIQLLKLVKEKEESDQRVAKLEEEVTALKLSATQRKFVPGKNKKKSINSIRISNEGREIAAFEEETLALRRELQEARASRNLAENHAAKCVNFAVSRSVTPVTFDSPCITSTPVRTALTDTCSLSPALPSAISSHTSSSTSVLRSSRSAEVAALQFVSETTDHCRNSGTNSEINSWSATHKDPSRPSTENKSEWCSETTSAPCQTTVTCTNNDITNEIGIKPQNKSVNQNSDFIDFTKTFWEAPLTGSADYLIFLEQKIAQDDNIARNDEKVKSSMSKEEIQAKRLTTDVPLEKNVDRFPGKCAETKMKSITEEDETRILLSPSVLEEQKDSPDKRISDVTSQRMERSIDHVSWQRMCEFRNQRGSFKKPRRKKTNLKRSFSETDKNSRQEIKILVDTTSPCSSRSIGASCDTMSEDEGCCPNDNHTNRDITDVPDVAVVGGGSIVPKDLCSTRPQTSRTQTAPSRATYTTAYI